MCTSSDFLTESTVQSSYWHVIACFEAKPILSNAARAGDCSEMALFGYISKVWHNWVCYLSHKVLGLCVSSYGLVPDLWAGPGKFR